VSSDLPSATPGDVELFLLAIPHLIEGQGENGLISYRFVRKGLRALLDWIMFKFNVEFTKGHHLRFGNSSCRDPVMTLS
jgi:hypothetical protein